MRNSVQLFPLVFALLLLLLRLPAASSASDYDYGAHPRFVCTPVPLDHDPACFPATGPSVGAAGPGGAGHQSVPPAGWWGASEEAKATILHLRESLVQQKETILDQRETIRELTAKLTLCEGFGRTPHDDHHSAAPQHGYASNGHYGNQQGHHGNSNLIPDAPHNPAVGGQRPVGREKDKHVTPGDITSSPEQMERMLQALKERLDNLQVRRRTFYTCRVKRFKRKVRFMERKKKKVKY